MINKNEIKTKLGRIIIIGGLGLGLYSLIKYENQNNFTRIVTEDGNYELNGFISYDYLKFYYVIEFKSTNDEVKTYIASYDGKPGNRIYYDIYSGKKLIKEYDKNLISSTNLEKLLISYDMIKEKYFSDDIEYLLNRYKEELINNEIKK